MSYVLEGRKVELDSPLHASTIGSLGNVFPSDGKAYDYYGYSVDIDGHFAVVGARLHDSMGQSNSGAAVRVQGYICTDCNERRSTNTPLLFYCTSTFTNIVEDRGHYPPNSGPATLQIPNLGVQLQLAGKRSSLGASGTRQITLHMLELHLSLPGMLTAAGHKNQN